MNETNAKTKRCLIACSVLKREIQQLISQHELDVDVVFVSKAFHVDFGLLEKHLRLMIERTQPRYAQKPILVYGDLCLGLNGEMKKLAEEYGLTKIDALNCIDCLLGGKGQVEQADPNHEFMFMDPGMIEFFRDAQEKLKQEGMDEDALKGFFSGIKGIVLLDTLEEAEKCKKDLEELRTGLKVLETKNVGLNSLKKLIAECMKPTAKP